LRLVPLFHQQLGMPRKFQNIGRARPRRYLITAPGGEIRTGFFSDLAALRSHFGVLSE
jgi:hypothetical protein